MKHIIFLILALPQLLPAQCLQEVNFNEWQVQGNPNAQWFILDDSTVMENGDAQPPTFFISTQQLINVRITGTMRVNYHNDDDFVGIVFGYQAPTNSTYEDYYRFILFDWKKAEGSFEGVYADEGMTLSRVNMQMDYEETWLHFWGHNYKAGEFEVLAKKYGHNRGWDYDVDYDYELTYTTTRIVININGDTVFNVDGCFEPGYFGFYSFSQQNSVFSNFNYELSAEFIASPLKICQGETISFITADPECTVIPTNIVGYSWDYGDGSAGNGPNPTHTFAIPGEYDVKLVITDDIGCQDSVSHRVRVNPIPVVYLGPDTIVDYGASYSLSAGNPGAEYEWSTGEDTEAISVENIRRDTMISVIVYLDGCISSDEILIRSAPPPLSRVVIPNAFTPDGDGLNDSFGPVMVNVTNFRFMIFDRWGKLVFTSSETGSRWDGRCGATPCPGGVYVWKLDYDAYMEGDITGSKTEAGVVTLLR